MTVTVSALMAKAICPTSPIKANTNTTIKGAHSGKIKNNGETNIVVNVTVGIRDSEGHTNTNTDPIPLQAGEEKSFSYDTPLLVSYQKLGIKTVTATTVVASSPPSSATGTCAITVINA